MSLLVQEPAPAPDSATGFRTSIKKEEINALHLRRYAGPVEVIASDVACEQAVKRLRRESILGFDTETRPSFKKGQGYLPSLVQLGGADCVYVFQLAKIREKKKLFKLLANKDIGKAGVATDFDVKQLQEVQPFKPAGFINLETITDELGIMNNGLRSLTAIVLGFRITKGEQRSNWSRVQLTDQQIRYAATDAWASREIYLRLNGANAGAFRQGDDGSKPCSREEQSHKPE